MKHEIWCTIRIPEDWNKKNSTQKTRYLAMVLNRLSNAVYDNNCHEVSTTYGSHFVDIHAGTDV